MTKLSGHAGYVANRIAIRARHKRYAQENPEKMYSYHKKWKDKQDSYDAKWYWTNPDRQRERKRQYLREVLSKDPHYIIKNRVSGRMWKALKSRKEDYRTTELLGCSVAALIAHLERQFSDGMSWSNVGKWHIDHITPIALFDLSNPVQMQQVFHYTNLQPLWAKDNLRKHTKLTYV